MPFFNDSILFQCYLRLRIALKNLVRKLSYRKQKCLAVFIFCFYKNKRIKLFMKSQELIKRYISGISQGLATSLMIVGKAGIGKTESVLLALKDLGLEEDKDYQYIPNYLTPKALILKLQEINNLPSDKKILVADDCEDTFRNLQSIGIIKGATWQTPNGKRIVSWITARENIRFDFTGKIIFLLNEFKKDHPLFSAIKDRALYFEMKLSREELLNLIREKIKNDYKQIPLEIKNNIVEIINKVGSTNISLRALPKSIQLYQLSPNHYQMLISAMLQEKI